jgi:hypothetical protein
MISCLPLATTQATEHDVTDVPTRVAFINPGYGDRGFWKDVRDTMQAASDQFGYELIVFDSNRDSKMMIESAQKVFALEPAPDYIIAVNEHQQGTRIVLEAEERGIPVIMLLNDLTKEQKNAYGYPGRDFDHWIFSLTPDNERAGYDIAKSLIDSARLQTENRQPARYACYPSPGTARHQPRFSDCRGLIMRLVVFRFFANSVVWWQTGHTMRHTVRQKTGLDGADASMRSGLPMMILRWVQLRLWRKQGGNPGKMSLSVD